MRASKKLSNLNASCCARLRRLEARLNGISVSSIGVSAEIMTSNVAIEALTSWANFSRAYYLSCFLLPKTASKLSVSITPVVPIVDALGFAIQIWKPKAAPNTAGIWSRRDEPVWHDPNTLLRLMTIIGSSSLADVQATFSLGYTVFRDLPVCRNFFAHRNRDTENAAMNLALRYGIAGSPRPAKMLLSFPYGGTEPLLLKWLHEIEFTVQYLCN
jgi:hypothetical protein